MPYKNIGKYNSHPRLRLALEQIGKRKPVCKALLAVYLIIWELMKTQTKLAKLEKRLAKHGM